MGHPYKHITPEEAEFFLAHGYLVVKGAFSRAQAAEFTQDMWVRLGLDPDEPSTWDRERIHMPSHRREPVATFAPRVWEIMKELLGGEERIDPVSSAWGDSFIVNLGVPPAAEAGDPPPASLFGSASPTPAALANWHVDGDFFVHFLDSPEQALLVIPLFSDIAPGGGATYIAPDGLPAVARYLAAHPEGVVAAKCAFVSSLSPTLRPGAPDPPSADPSYRSHPAEVAKCADFVELTGSTGDVVLLHPLMPHSASPNLLRVPRVITNPPVGLRAPFCFDRADPAEYSLVERATLRALGVDRLAFAPTTPRRTIVPARVGIQAKMIEEETRRLEAAQQQRQADAVGLGHAKGASAQAIAVA